MDYKPRYPQPFTLAEATALDISVISEGGVVIQLGRRCVRLIIVTEISRLQNSLKYLSETQEVLKAALAESTEPPDAEISQAFEEIRSSCMFKPISITVSLAPVLIIYLSSQQRFTGRTD